MKNMKLIRGKTWFTLPAGSLIEEHNEETDCTIVHKTSSPLTVYVEDQNFEVRIASAEEILECSVCGDSNQHAWLKGVGCEVGHGGKD